MPEGPALGVGAHDAGEGLRAHLALQRREGSRRAPVGAPADIGARLEPPARANDGGLVARRRPGRTDLHVRDVRPEQRPEQPAGSPGKELREVPADAGGVHDLLRRPGADALVEPRLLELVGGHHPLPPVVRHLVDGDLPEQDVVRLSRVDPGVDGGEGGVLHPARLHVDAHRGSHQREVRVGVRQPVTAPLLEGDLRCGEDLGRGPRPVGWDEQGQRHLRQTLAAEDVAHLHRPLPGGPGEVDDVVLVEAVGDGPVRVVGAASPEARRADHHRARDGERRVVVAEVGVELGVRVELVAVPARGAHAALRRHLQHADLREPLSEQGVLPEDAGTRGELRHARLPGELDRHLAVGRDRGGKGEGEDGLVARVAVIGPLPAKGGPNVGSVGQPRRA